MTGKCRPPRLITPEEAVKVFGYASIDSFFEVAKLWKYGSLNIKHLHGEPVSFVHTALLAFIYETGRVQGIREERARRKADRKQALDTAFSACQIERPYNDVQTKRKHTGVQQMKSEKNNRFCL